MSIDVLIAGALVALHLRAWVTANTDRELSNLSLVLANSVENNLRSAELLQESVLEQIASKNITSVQQFDQSFATHDVYEDLRARIAGLPQVEAIFLSDAKGRTVISSRLWPWPSNVSIADRNYFRDLKENPTHLSYFGEPSHNQITGTWNLYLSHRVQAPDGSFLGIVVVVLDLAYFERFFGSIALGPGSSIGLLRRDGILLARYPDVGGAVGSSKAHGAIFTSLHAGMNGIIIRITSTVDGQDRIVSARALSHYPVVAVVSRTIKETLLVWRRQALYTAGATLLLIAAILSMSSIGARQIRSRAQLAEANSELAVARERNIQSGRLSAALNGMSQGLCMFGEDDCVIVSNARLAEILGLVTSIVQKGVHISSLVEAAVQHGNLPAETAAELTSRVASAPTDAPVSLLQVLRDGRTVSINWSRIITGGWLVTLEDVTEQRQAEARIAHLAHHDPLTGLPNRALFHERFEKAVLNAKPPHLAAVLYLDLDRFKEVNDTFGHPVGDALLCIVADRIKSEIRERDIVARLGGDEFAIVQTGLTSSEESAALAKRLISVLGAPFEPEGEFVVLGTSIGIAMAPNDGVDPDQLLKNADIALYRAKESGRGSYRFFEPEMDTRMQLRRVLEIDLRQAITNQEFELFYQPIVNLLLGRVSGFEALIRWHHPKNGLMMPDRFISLAEELGLIIPIGAWALSQACAEASHWPEGIKVAVNLSPLQFAGPGLDDAISAALGQSGLDPARLELEITETVLLKDTESTLATLHALKALGIGIVLDDFGTGYSSLSYLQRFPFDRVKIDRSFVKNLGDMAESAAIVCAISALCASLKMATTAEGIETAQQLRLVAASRCTDAQGYFFSRPCSAADVPMTLKKLAEQMETTLAAG